MTKEIPKGKVEQTLENQEVRLGIERALLTVLEGLDEIEDNDLREGCKKILEDHFEKIITAPGSRHNHQAWIGGYIGHLADTFRIGRGLLETFPERTVPVAKGDFFLVMFLHDIEKPFAYGFDEDGSIVAKEEFREKPAKKAFRAAIIEEYGLNLTEQHLNALQYVEGIPTKDYRPGDRVMNELAGVCHMADTGSARVWHNYPNNPTSQS